MNRTIRKARKLTTIPLLAIVAAGIAIGAFYLVPYLRQSELVIHQWRVNRSLRIDPHPDILLVVADDQSAYRLKQRDTREVPRQTYAQLIRGLDAAGAKVILLDVKFDTPMPDADAEIQEAARALSNSHLIFVMDRMTENFDEVRGEWEFTFQPSFSAPAERSEHISEGSARAANPDGKIRGVLLLQNDVGAQKWVPHVSLLAAARFLGAAEGPEEAGVVFDQNNREVSVGRLHWPVSSEGFYAVRWTERPSDFPRVELSKALDELESETARNRYRNKLVLIGDLKEDEKPTSIGDMPGIDVLAQITNSLLQPGDSHPVRGIEYSVAWTFTVAVLSVLIGRARQFRSVVGGGFGIGLLVYSIPEFALQSRIWIDTIMPALSGLAGGALGLAALGQRLFAEQWIDPNISKYEKPTKCVVLVVDLIGSTRIVSAMSTSAMSSLLSRLVTEWIVAARKEGAVFVKGLGDGILAIFPNDSDRVFRTFDRIVELTGAIGLEFGSHLECSAGSESGSAQAARIVARGRSTWDFFGETIHLTARLQEKGKSSPNTMCVGPVLRNLAGDSHELEIAGRFIPRGLEDTYGEIDFFLYHPSKKAEGVFD